VPMPDLLKIPSKLKKKSETVMELYVLHKKCKKITFYWPTNALNCIKLKG